MSAIWPSLTFFSLDKNFPFAKIIKQNLDLTHSKKYTSKEVLS